MSPERATEPLGAAEIVAFVREHPDGVVSTLGPHGAPQAAYLPFAATDGDRASATTGPTRPGSRRPEGCGRSLRPARLAAATEYPAHSPARESRSNTIRAAPKEQASPPISQVQYRAGEATLKSGTPMSPPTVKA